MNTLSSQIKKTSTKKTSAEMIRRLFRKKPPQLYISVSDAQWLIKRKGLEIKPPSFAAWISDGSL